MTEPVEEDRSVWGDTTPEDPSVEECQRLTVSALGAMLRGDRDAATDCIEYLAGVTGRDLFSAAFAWARTVARASVAPDERDGHYTVSVERMRGRDPGDTITEDEVRNVAAFIAAAGNKDGRGAAAMWAAMTADECCKLAIEVLNVATVVVGSEPR